MVVRLYCNDNPVIMNLRVPDGTQSLIYKGVYYTKVYDSENAVIFLYQRQQARIYGPLYWDYDNQVWIETATGAVYYGPSKGVKPGYTLSIERANELLAEQDKKIIELIEEVNWIRDKANQSERDNAGLRETNEFLSTVRENQRVRIQEARDKNNELHKENESLKGHISFLIATINREHEKVVQSGREIARLQKVLSEISITADNATKQKANSVNFPDAANWASKQEAINREMKELAEQTAIPDDVRERMTRDRREVEKNSKFKPFYNFEEGCDPSRDIQRESEKDTNPATFYSGDKPTNTFKGNRLA